MERCTGILYLAALTVSQSLPVQSVASTRVQSVGCGEGDVPPPHREHPPYRGRSLGGDKFFWFCDLKWRILVKSEVINLKFFFIASFLSGVWVDSVENFGFSSKTVNKRHH